MNFKPVVCFLPFLMALVSCNILTCEYSLLNLQGTTMYTCVAKNIALSIDNSDIINVIGSHAHGKVNSDVQAIKFQNSKGAFIVGLSKFFFNLKMIDASGNEFTYVEGIHFKGLKALEVVNFRETKISTLFKDTFKDNPSLKFVSFFGSQIRSIEQGFLTSLPTNIKIAFGENPCVPGVPGLTINENQNAIKNSCKLPYPLGEKLQTLENDLDLTKIDLEVTQKNLTISLTALNDLNLRSTQTIRDLSGARDKLLGDNRELIKQVSDLRINLPVCNNGILAGDTCSVDLKICKDKVAELVSSPISEVSVKGKCNFERDTQNSDYTCFAVSLDIRNENTILSDVVGRHEPQKSNKDVTSLFILNQNVISLPKNIIEHFPSLTRLVVRKSNLINLSKPTLDKMINLRELDLKRNLLKSIPSGLLDLNVKLEKLDLSENQIVILPPQLLKNQNSLSFFAAAGNQIAALDKDLFIGTPILQTVLLNNNKISYVHASTFGSLKAALTIDLKNNTCINDSFSGSSILNLASSLLSLCVEDAPCV